jgi:hypothetical protein
MDTLASLHLQTPCTLHTCKHPGRAVLASRAAAGWHALPVACVGAAAWRRGWVAQAATNLRSLTPGPHRIRWPRVAAGSADAVCVLS